MAPEDRRSLSRKPPAGPGAHSPCDTDVSRLFRGEETLDDAWQPWVGGDVVVGGVGDDGELVLGSQRAVDTGVALVTILLLGEYLIPQLLGGGKVFFIGNALVDLFLQSRNWPFGSAIAVTLVVVVVVVLTAAMRIAWRIAGTRQVDLL